MLDPRNPSSIPHMINLASKPIVILGNGPQIDRMQAAFWDRLNKIQAQADSELVVVGINRIGVADACLKHRYKPDVLATVDKPMLRVKGPKDITAEHAARAKQRDEEERTMAPLKRTNPKAYEQWEATRNQLFDMEMKEDAKRVGATPEYVLTPTSDAFMRSFATCAGVSIRVVSPQAIEFLKPQRVPDKDVIVNMDTSLTGPPDRAKMLFTTADWVTNWFARIGCRTFYYYGVSMRDGGHCKCLGLDQKADDDYSWTVPGRQHTCFKAWDALRDAFPGLKLYNCDRRSLFVENETMEYGTPPQIDPSYRLLTDDECMARARAVIADASSGLAAAMDEQVKKAREVAEIAKLRARMEADRVRVAV